MGGGGGRKESPTPFIKSLIGYASHPLEPNPKYVSEGVSNSCLCCLLGIHVEGFTSVQCSVTSQVMGFIDLIDRRSFFCLFCFLVAPVRIMTYLLCGLCLKVRGKRWCIKQGVNTPF